LFDGEKTVLFWVGLGIVGLASTFYLFNSLWSIVIRFLRGYDLSYYYWQVSNIVSGIAFTLIGLYMMKSGAKKERE